MTTTRLRAGWSEQDPADWIRATEEAVAGLRAAHPADLSAVRGIGLSGHMHGATLLDADGRRLATVMRNALATGWTMSVRFDDPVLPKQLGTDAGRMVLHASVDTEHDPWARVGNSPLRLQRCEVAVSA